MGKQKERVANNIQENIPGRVIYQTPERMGEVLPDKRKWLNKEKPEPGDIVKAQVEKFREIYRILRSELHNDEWSDDLKIIVPGSFQMKTTIESHLLEHFPQEYDKHIQFACYIEEYVNSFPDDPFKAWVTVPRVDVKNLIANAFNSGYDRYTVYTMLGTYLWSFKGHQHIIADDIEDQQQVLEKIKGQLIQSHKISRIYDSFRVCATKVRAIWEEVGVTINEIRTRPGEGYQTQSEIFIPNESPIFQMAKIAPSLGVKKLRQDANIRLQLPENLDAKIIGYFFHYPVDSEGFLNSAIPIIFDNSTTLTIPLVHQTGPMVIAALFSVSELAGTMSHISSDIRNQTIKTIFKHACKGLEQFDKTVTSFNRENHRINLTHLDNRDIFHRLITGISVRGLGVDVQKLKSLDINKLVRKSSSRSKMRSEREKIIKRVEMNEGKLFAQYHLKSRTERVYSRFYNIQGMPKVFHQVIEAAPGHEFIYFDIVANDLSMIFNMINDQNGIETLKGDGDPYAEIAFKAFGDSNERQRVKLFVSPHLYGASNTKIINDSDGQLNRRAVTQITAAFNSLYPITADWLNNVRSSAEKGLIPDEYNLIDGVDIPIPPIIGPTVGPAMIIQRYGARLFRAIICGLSGIGYNASAFVHDSLLIQVPVGRGLTDALFEIREQINVVRFSRGLKVLGIMIGHGKTWQEADKASIRQTFHD